MSGSRSHRKRQPSVRKDSSHACSRAAHKRASTGVPLGSNHQHPVLITGGAGFIGTNLADRLLTSGVPVLVYDNLARRGSEVNLDWLANKHGSLLRVEIADVRDAAALGCAARDSAAVFHFAAQVAVTDSLTDPKVDFDVNARGTFNILEAIRSLPNRPPLLFTSTNKVYGAMSDLKLRKGPQGYSPTDGKTAARGISELRPLEFCSPYGCSKGSADQYVLDYARTYGFCSAVFRMSCIYGPHQFGTEDQGWIAHFLIRAREGKTITIYGDGSQVRDILYIDDLIDAFLLALQSITEIRGQAFNIGGGASNTLNLLQLVQHISELQASPCSVRFDQWRPGDQRYYVSDTSEFRKATGWSPKVGVRDGISRLYRWLEESAPAERTRGSRAASPIEFPHLEPEPATESLVRTG